MYEKAGRAECAGLLAGTEGGVPDLRHDALEIGFNASALVRRPGAGVRPELANLGHHFIDERP